MIQVLFGPSKYRVLGVSFLDPCFFFLISLMLKPKAKNKTLSISTNFEIPLKGVSTTSRTTYAWFMHLMGNWEVHLSRVNRR